MRAADDIKMSEILSHSLSEVTPSAAGDHFNAWRRCAVGLARSQAKEKRPPLGNSDGLRITLARGRGLAIDHIIVGPR